MHWTTLVILVIVVLVYILVGGAIFMTLENDHEAQLKNETVINFIRFLTNNTCVTTKELESFTQAVISAYDSGVLTASKKSNWSNWNYESSTFFAVTVITSVGYGHISPATSGGQLFFIFYAIVGIPLSITMLIGIGERLSRPYTNIGSATCFSKSRKMEKMLKFLLYTLFYFITFSLVPAVIIMHFEDWTFLEAWYYTVVTLTTVGFGDYVPGAQSRHNRLFYKILTGIWIFCGLAWLTMLFHMAVHFVQIITNKVDAASHYVNKTYDDQKQVLKSSKKEEQPLLA